VSALSVQTAFLLLFAGLFLFLFLAGVLRVGRYIQELDGRCIHFTLHYFIISGFLVFSAVQGK
jgi:hypothetical protein